MLEKKAEFKQSFEGTEKALPHQRRTGRCWGNEERERQTAKQRQESKDKPVVKRKGKNSSQISHK